MLAIKYYPRQQNPQTQIKRCSILRESAWRDFPFLLIFPYKRPVLICRIGAAVIDFFYSRFCFLILHFILLSPYNYSIIQPKKFVNVPKRKQFMNEWAILCYMALCAVISRYSVLSHAGKIFAMHALCPLSMVKINGRAAIDRSRRACFSVIKQRQPQSADAA